MDGIIEHYREKRPNHSCVEVVPVGKQLPAAVHSPHSSASFLESIFVYTHSNWILYS